MIHTKHIMIDLETMGKSHSPVLCTFAAAIFDIKTGEVSDTFYKKIDIETCEQVGLKYDGSTIKFWLQQDAEAMQDIVHGLGLHLHEVLLLFKKWIIENEASEFPIWANGIHADLVWLKSAYNACQLQEPWDFRMERDVRTLVAFNPAIKKSTNAVGVAHNALDDVFYQINYCSAIFNTINVL